MRTALLGLSALALAGLPLQRAHAWAHAGAWGHASGGGGSWSASGWRGGSASGGGGSWHATGPYGGTAYGGYHGYYGGYYGGYHPPIVVNHYSTGCYNCGGWGAGGAVAAGLVGATVGAAAGAAVASAATSNAYAAGVATGAATANAGYIMGDIYPTLPAGCSYSRIGGVSYYGCNDGAWFTPSYGANGVFYRVVPTP
ncbi:MAG TPA: hypothetical protein VHS58_16915, partial [Acetobacteraceae bacterium]|jgi:hypothetical protein|nr:hypothetical protein [Acetobacteraceae bacterium]